ncbi:leucine-rich repeat and death domain-containing protein 1-like isoform X2 [Coccinella septempunctata]|uniref:leucine-rich repeat and death domain-containing protein 1-like isoform X2 n=1 Tax=Coccinella septempunctata TaxID=41139 RepID=UPI001D06DE51|nr:leucine-rich repeat and death domain-containing protein 1-like isoform X2 [Coccinella septempunctata]
MRNMEKHFIRIATSGIHMRNSRKKTELEKETLENILKLYKSPNVTSLEGISELDLSNCKLFDITCGLKELQLRKLNLSKNEMTQVPRCFYLGLEILEFLDISYNKINSFDVEPNCCSTLKVLILCSNNLKDIPQWIMNHRAIRLKELYYDLNKITSLRCIFGSTMLFSVAKLSLRNCYVRDEDFDFLKNCRYLEELDISNSVESSVNLNSLKAVDKLLYQPNWKNLSILKMNNLSLSVFPDALTWLEGLTELHLANNYLVWLPKDGLEFFVNLEVLNVSHNSISCLPEKLTWLIYLKVLNLSYNTLEETCDFTKMKSLEILDLYSNKLENFSQNFVCTNLKCLDLEMNLFDTKEYNLATYEEMKKELRMRIPEEKRYDGATQLETNSWKSSDDESYSYSGVLEDWDEEINLREQITASDNEWTGESPTLPHIPITHYEKPSIYNDEVLFCDAD